MVTYLEAYEKVLEHPLHLGIEEVLLEDSLGRILAEDILADRDFPPFDRVTKDGIAIAYQSWEKGRKTFRIQALASAGMPQQELTEYTDCIEVMTGAMVPKNADTVVMYEHCTIEEGVATIQEKITQGQNIHYQGSDEHKGATLIKSGRIITPAEIGILAAVGKSAVQVRALPVCCVIATGNELVEIDDLPAPQQIRKSNSITLLSALKQQNINASTLHLLDTKENIAQGLDKALQQNDVLLISGGVSMGKFDLIPEVLIDLGVKKVFHKVSQRPGKPFWFGVHEGYTTVVFSFPGNPVSTFVNYHVYFLPWLRRSLHQRAPFFKAKLAVSMEIVPPLTRFIQVSTVWEEDILWVDPINQNGSGDLLSLGKADGFIRLEPKNYEKGEEVPFIRTR